MSKLQVGICRLGKNGPGGATKCLMTMAEHWAQRFDVTLFTNEPVNWAQMQLFFGIDLSRVKLAALQPLPTDCRHLLLAVPRRGKWLYQLATQAYYAQQIRARQLDLFMNHSPDLALPPLAKRSIYLCTFPNVLPQSAGNSEQSADGRNLVDKSRAWVRRTLTGPSSLQLLQAYDMIVANSRFTQGWIQQRWGLPSTIIYTACELVDGVSPKAKIIGHVGKFAADIGNLAMNKRQDVLIETFKALPDLHQTGWQLHLAGGCDLMPENQVQVAALQRAAEGYPIFFHVNASLAALQQLYRTATLYWHASGYGSDAQCYPNTQEHFGITVVEAMSAGAIPVVFNSGGPTETVTHGVNGFVWNHLSELTAYTRSLAADEPLRSALSQQAIAHSQHFSKANFLARLDAVVDQLFAEKP